MVDFISGHRWVICLAIVILAVIILEIRGRKKGHPSIIKDYHKNKCEAIFLLITTIIGVVALATYQDQARISLENHLNLWDNEIQSKFFNNPGLYSIYYNYKKPSSENNAKEIADTIIKNSLTAMYNDKNIQILDQVGIRNNQQDNKQLTSEVYEFTDLPFEWTNIKELNCSTWGYNGIEQEEWKVLLRKLQSSTDAILYLLYNAYSGMTGDMYSSGPVLDNTSYNTWKAYLSEVGFNPFFLSSILNGVASGYIDEDYARQLKQDLYESPKNKIFIEALFPEMKDNDWPDKLITQRNQLCDDFVERPKKITLKKITSTKQITD